MPALFRARAGVAAAAALLLGLLLPFAFAPYAHWWLAPLGLAALFVLWHDTTPRAAAWRGYLFGLGFLGHGVGWVQISIHQFGLPLYVFSVSMTALFVMFISLYPALAGWLLRRLPARGEVWRLCALAPVLWTASEWARGYFFSGFPWLLLGDSQLDSPLAGWLPVLGAQGASLVLALSAGALATAVVQSRRRAWLLAGAVLPWLLGAVLMDIEWTRPDGPSRTVAIVQGAVPQSMKWSPEARAATLERYASLTAPHWGADIIVWPETALPAFPAEIPEFLAELKARAQAAGSVFLLGLPTAETAERYFNSLVLLGTADARYDKHHLVPFGEYLPFDALLRPALDFLSIPMSGFTPGPAQQAALRAGELRIGATICYEDAYASEVRKALPAANLLVNVSNDAWFGDSAAPHQHLQITRVRAAEAGREFLRATNTGISAIIDHHGGLRSRSPQFEPYVLKGEVTPRTGSTPFVRLGHGPLALACLLLLLCAIKRSTQSLCSD
jgi:apolipoprotein N-acyltransferase